MSDHAEQPLTTDQVRANAGNWTLAGDVGLLAHLKQFSDGIIEKAETTEKSLNSLLDQVEETCTNFNNVSNQFLALQNSQFLENRVYDDETPTEEKERPVQPVEETQQQTLERYKEAVTIGIGLLYTHFEEAVLLESSDSDEEAPEFNPAVVLRPVTKYLKSLPLVIGSAEWWADDNVGLGEFQENEDSEPEITFTDSGPDDIRPQIEKRLIRTSSSSSVSSLDAAPIPVVQKPNIPTIITIPAIDEPPALPTNDEDDTEDMFKPVDDLFGYVHSRSLFDNRQDNLFSSTGDDLFPGVSTAQHESASEDLFNQNEDPLTAKNVKAVDKIVSNAFTKELAAKLGTVAKNQETQNKSQPVVKSVEKNVEARKSPDLFNDVGIAPPVAKTRTVTIKPQPEKPAAPPQPEMRKRPDLRKPTGLFGEDDEDNDDLFSGASGRKSTVANVRAKESTSTQLFDDNDDDDDLFGGPKKKDLVNENKLRGSSTYDSMPKPAARGSPGLFSGFDDDLDDFNLFAPKAVPKGLPNAMLAANNSMDHSPGVKTSTPALQGTPAVSLDPNPSDDLFGSISKVADESREESQVSVEPSFFHQDSQIDANPADVGMMNDTRDESRDLGFAETSSVGEENSSKKESPVNWFHPQLSSTQAVGSSHETSGYKTGVGDLAGADSRSDSKQPEKRVSSISEDSSLIAAHTQKSCSKIDDLFAESSRKSTNWGLVDESDELFSSSSSKQIPPAAQSRRVKIEPDLFGSTDTDDLFAIQPKTPQHDKKEEQLVAQVKATSWKPSSIFDDEDDVALFDDGKTKLPDNVSVSSSRSSLFDEPAAGKSNLPSIFENREKDTYKVSLFDDVEDNFDLFGKSEEKKPEPPRQSRENLQKPRESDLLAENNDDDLFGAASSTSTTSVVSKSPARESSRPKPPSSLSVTKTSDLLSDEHDGEAKTAVSKKIGKLSIPSSLKINPAALLPGSRPVKVTAEESEPALDVTSSVVLTSTVRDRPRIQVKRRPQTRKARHEALRVSGIDFGGEAAQVNVDQVVSPGSDKDGSNALFHSVDNSPSPAFASAVVSSVLSPSTDEEDYFNVPELDSNEREEQNIFQKEPEPAVVGVDDDALFSSAPVSLLRSSVVSKNEQVKHEDIPKPGHNRNDEIDDDDLFGAPVPTTSKSLFDNEAVPTKTTTLLAAKPKLASLFDDNDDDDIFSGKSTKPAAVLSQPKPESVPSVPKSTVEKVKEPFVDPLGLLQD